MQTFRFQELQHVAQTRGRSAFVSMQGHHNLLYREADREMRPYCQDTGVGYMAVRRRTAP